MANKMRNKRSLNTSLNPLDEASQYWFDMFGCV